MATGPTDEAIVADWESKLSSEVKAYFETRKKDRAVVRAKLTKALNLMESAMKKTDPSAAEIEFHMGKVNSAYDDLEAKDLGMYDYLLKAPDVRDADQRIGNHYYTRSGEAIGQAKEAIESLKCPSSTASVSNASTSLC